MMSGAAVQGYARDLVEAEVRGFVAEAVQRDQTVLCEGACDRST